MGNTWSGDHNTERVGYIEQNKEEIYYLLT